MTKRTEPCSTTKRDGGPTQTSHGCEKKADTSTSLQPQHKHTHKNTLLFLLFLLLVENETFKTNSGFKNSGTQNKNRL